MAKEIPNIYPTLPDDTSSGDETPPELKATVEERHYDTILGSPQAATAALTHFRVQANPVIPHFTTKKKSKRNPQQKNVLVSKSSEQFKTQSTFCTIL